MDVLEVADDELARLPEDPTDRLHVMAHAWAAASATSLQIQAVSPAGTLKSGTVRTRVATPGPLVAMKLQAIMNRPVVKEGTDLLDIVRLVLDPVAGPIVLKELKNADSQISRDAALHARRWFVEQRRRTIQVIHRIPDGNQMDLDSIDFVADLLLGELDK